MEADIIQQPGVLQHQARKSKKQVKHPISFRRIQMLFALNSSLTHTCAALIPSCPLPFSPLSSQKHLMSHPKNSNFGPGHYHEGKCEVWHPRQLDTGIDHTLDLSSNGGA
jgi:hypothetical protein